MIPWKPNQFLEGFIISQTIPMENDIIIFKQPPQGGGGGASADGRPFRGHGRAVGLLQAA
jgi:hypothetical protein